MRGSKLKMTNGMEEREGGKWIGRRGRGIEVEERERKNRRLRTRRRGTERRSRKDEDTKF